MRPQLEMPDMPDGFLRPIIVLLMLCILATTAFGANCPYCGRVYGGGSSTSGAYLARIRREHEATCSSRPANQGSSGGNSGQSMYEWRIRTAEGHYQNALQAYNEGDYRKTIAKCRSALWHRWGHRKYLDLLKLAQTKQRAQNYHKTGGVNPTEQGQLAMTRGLKAVSDENWSSAIAQFMRARGEAPQSPEVLYNLALAYDKIGGREIPAIIWYREVRGT